MKLVNLIFGTMKILGLGLLLFLVSSCGGNLTEEQRKRLKEGMRLQEIRKLSDAQITEAAFALGRKINGEAGSHIHDDAFVDSLAAVYGVEILKLQMGDSMALAVERQIIEAYTSGADAAVLSDNIQKAGPDTLVYTQPIMRTLPDGASQFSHVIAIRMPKKQVVLSIE
jgi:hypothetical protein